MPDTSRKDNQISVWFPPLRRGLRALIKRQADAEETSDGKIVLRVLKNAQEMGILLELMSPPQAKEGNGDKSK